MRLPEPGGEFLEVTSDLETQGGRDGHAARFMTGNSNEQVHVRIVGAIIGYPHGRVVIGELAHVIVTDLESVPSIDRGRP